MNRLTFLATTQLFVFALTTFAIVPDTLAQDTPKVTVRVDVGSKSLVGRVIAVDSETMVLLRRSGRMTMIPRERIEGAKTVSKTFKPYPAEAIRKSLQKEFGNKYQVSTTQHFIVVHPIGDYQIWAMPFEKLYRRYINYFASRNVRLEEPQFPMVAVVLRTRNEFDRFLQRYHEANENILGYYSPRSNRIITYDHSDGQSEDEEWFFTADTIVHEATHQTAFNTGLHTRFAPTPVWISEGLATMFEAPGVQNSLYHSKQRDRINYGRLNNLLEMYAKDMVDETLIGNMVATDRLFESNPGAAYALAWGLTFYLSETQPDRYVDFLKQDSTRSDWEDYPSRDRLEAFVRKFGKISKLAPRLKQFIEQLPEEKK